MSRPLLKVCGVTLESEVEDLCRLGVDFFGLLVEATSPFVLDESRASQLAKLQQQSTRATLVTDIRQPDELKRLITELGVAAIQLGVRVSPSVIKTLRESFTEQDLTIIQEISYRPSPAGEGRFLKENLVPEFLDAGVNLILLDRLEKGGNARPDEGPIPAADLAAFRDRNPQAPILIAAGINSQNAANVLKSSEATGIDVCSSVRSEGAICPVLVEQLMQQMARELP